MHDYPKPPAGGTEAQIDALWDTLFRLIETLNLKEAENE